MEVISYSNGGPKGMYMADKYNLPHTSIDPHLGPTELRSLLNRKPGTASSASMCVVTGVCLLYYVEAWLERPRIGGLVWAFWPQRTVNHLFPQIPLQELFQALLERAPSSLTRLFLTVAPTVTNEIGDAAASAAAYGSSCRSSLDKVTLGAQAAADRLLAPRPARVTNSRVPVGERQRSDNESPVRDTF